MNPNHSKAVCTFILLNLFFIGCFAWDNLPCPPKSATPPPSTAPQKCPINTLKFGVCGSWLGLVREEIGSKPSEKCCSVVKGVADLEAALCLCTAIKANVLGSVKLKVPVAVTLLINACGKKVPSGFVCA
ncbi:putative lipid-binding protein At4g00165 [Vigna unguiculata]|uniref:Hydrophobic seed protein n=1 Tax=Vigna unguiculata TaxID=3917 RepID=A0A4D6NE28_VIGUN|nr:putative lipid-binding protein At4g00165 [Vigna unguiculata]QCE10435.1 Hydrophobic seed protein [Vigna unguiculata]